ncbi:MAG: hypothetical protein IJT96_10515 [Lachnospiraceae bacterium]|nr:hypothetical protein [Lachnospiraceae bacterium]
MLIEQVYETRSDLWREISFRKPWNVKVDGVATQETADISWLKDEVCRESSARMAKPIYYL